MVLSGVWGGLYRILADRYALERNREVPLTKEKVMPIIRESALLKPEQPLTFLVRDALLDPNEFFNRPGIVIDGVFRQEIMPALKPVASMPEQIYGVGSLKQDALHRVIRCELPKRHISYWTVIPNLIERYPNGTDRPLLLYLKIDGKVFTVEVGWGFGLFLWGGPGWWIGMSGRGRVGSRVLCPAPATRRFNSLTLRH